MGHFLILGLFILPLLSWADPTPEYYSPRPLTKKVMEKLPPNTVLHTKGGRYSKSSQIPKPEKRGEIFAKAQLLEETKDFDELAKDELFIRAVNYDVERLTSIYPEIKKEKLKILRDLARAN